MKKFLPVIILLLAIVFLVSFMNKNPDKIKNTEVSLPSIYPVEHASFVMTWGEQFIFNDPVGDIEKYSEMPVPHLILLSDIHGDHLDIKTLESLAGDRTIIIAPQAVADALSPILLSKTSVLKNAEAKIFGDGFLIEAIPMYNLPESEGAFHAKGRGNGYVINKDGVRVYIAGDTSGTPEMRGLKGIDMAFVPMNLPYTMDIEEAVDAVLEFKPRQVIPYHYRGKDGLSDVAKFKELVNASDPDIEVLLLDWYK